MAAQLAPFASPLGRCHRGDVRASAWETSHHLVDIFNAASEVGSIQVPGCPELL